MCGTLLDVAGEPLGSWSEGDPVSAGPDAPPLAMKAESAGR